MKVKDEIVLKEWIETIVILTELRETIETAIPNDLLERVIYVENDCKDILECRKRCIVLLENVV